MIKKQEASLIIRIFWRLAQQQERAYRENRYEDAGRIVKIMSSMHMDITDRSLFESLEVA